MFRGYIFKDVMCLKRPMDKWMCIVIDAALFMSEEGFHSPLLRRPDFVKCF
jgi:hypothetical protein